MNAIIAASLLHYCNVKVDACSGIKPHKIDYYDFTFVLDGTLIYFANGERIALGASDAILLPMGTLRERLSGTCASYVSFNFQLTDGEALPLPLFLPRAISSEMKNAVANFPPSHILYDSYEYGKCLSVLNYLLFSLLENFSYRTQNSHVRTMLDIIQKGITKRITLDAVSREISLSREYASYLFKREMGMPMTDYINRKRMELARGMILGGELPLSAIAAELGFENYHYFSRLFKSYFGITPIEQKKKSRKHG